MSGNEDPTLPGRPGATPGTDPMQPQKSPSQAETTSEPLADHGFNTLHSVGKTDEETASAAVEGVPRELLHHPRYRVESRLGSGGMGDVYLAVHKVMDRRVAIKLIQSAYLSDPILVERFHREMRAAARLSHPNIVAAYDAEQAGGLHFLCMEYVQGTDLSRFVKTHGPLSLMKACHYVRLAALGLQHAHEQGMVHRDVKPHNLMLTPTNQIKILDFGLARFVSEKGPGPSNPDVGLTEQGSMMGTADYIAPEQARDARTADIRADVYSLGCTLFYLLTGRAVFAGGTSMDKLLRHMSEEPPVVMNLRPDVPSQLADVLQKMIAKRPEDRWQTPGEVAKALEPILRNLVAGKREPAAVASPPVAAKLPPADRTEFVPAEKKKTTPTPRAEVKDGPETPKPTAKTSAAQPARTPARRRTEPEPKRTIKEKTIRRKARTSPGPAIWGLILVGLALAAAAAVGLSGVLRPSATAGLLEFESADPDLKINVLKGGELVRMIDLKVERAVKLDEGEYTLKLADENAGWSFSKDRVTLARGGKETIRLDHKIETTPPRKETATEQQPALKRMRWLRPRAAPDFTDVPPLFHADCKQPCVPFLNNRASDALVYKFAAGRLVLEANKTGYWNTRPFAKADNFGFRARGRTSEPRGWFMMAAGVDDHGEANSFSLHVTPAKSTLQLGPRTGPLTATEYSGPKLEPVHNNTIKGLGEYNNVLLLVIGKEIRMYANGDQVGKSYQLKRPLLNASLFLQVYGPNEVALELEGIDVWPAAEGDQPTASKKTLRKSD